MMENSQTFEMTIDTDEILDQELQKIDNNAAKSPEKTAKSFRARSKPKLNQ